jgi:hypothetical protein
MEVQLNECAAHLLFDFTAQLGTHFGLDEGVTQRALFGTLLSLDQYRDIFGGILQGFSNADLAYILLSTESKDPLAAEGREKVRELIRLLDKFLVHLNPSVLRQRIDLVEYSGSTVLDRLCSELDPIHIPPGGEQDQFYKVKRFVWVTCAQHGFVSLLRYQNERKKLMASHIIDCLRVAMRYCQFEVIRYFLSANTLQTQALMGEEALCDTPMLYPREAWKMLDLIREYPDPNFVHISIFNLARGRISEWTTRYPEIFAEIIEIFLQADYDTDYFGDVESHRYFLSLLPDEVVLKKVKQGNYLDSITVALLSTTHPHLFAKTRVIYYKEETTWVTHVGQKTKVLNSAEELHELAGQVDRMQINFLFGSIDRTSQK